MTEEIKSGGQLPRQALLIYMRGMKTKYELCNNEIRSPRSYQSYAHALQPTLQPGARGEADMHQACSTQPTSTRTGVEGKAVRNCQTGCPRRADAERHRSKGVVHTTARDVRRRAKREVDEPEEERW